MMNAKSMGRFSCALLVGGAQLGCQPPELIEAGNGVVSGAKPAVAVRNGQAVATWHRSGQVRFSAYDGASWSAPLPFGSGSFPEVAVSDGLAAIVLYGSSSSLKAVRRVSGGWSSHTLDTGPSFAYGVAMESGGRAAAVWSVSGEVRATIHEGGSWLPNTVLSTSAAFGGPQVAVNDSGVAFAAWCGQNNRMWGARRVAPGAWEAASSSATDCCTAPALDTPGAGISVGVSASGMAIMVGSTANRVCAKRYDPGSGWLGTSVIGTPGGDAVGAQVAVNPSGQALVAWNNFSSGGLIKVRAYDPVSGWASVLTGPGAGSGRLGLGIGSNGDGAVVYRASGAINAVPFSISSGTLSDPVTVASSTDTLYYLRVGFDPSEPSQGVSIWQRTGVGAENIWASRLGI
ncbi:MAG TPA: hypothetical protein VHP33_38435 [Polyangiaceae bacterium]|nr:hypothetical protein [Polyangiaceae bacterium]